MIKKEYAIFFGLAFELVGLVLTSLYAGRLLDDYLGTSGIFIGIGAIFAILIWIYHLTRALKNLNRD